MREGFGIGFGYRTTLCEGSLLVNDSLSHGRVGTREGSCFILHLRLALAQLEFPTTALPPLPYS